MKKIISFLFILSLSFSNIVFSQSGWFWVNPNPSYSNYEDIRFVNSMTGCAVGSNNTIIRTTDGGNSWNIIKESYQTTGYELFSLFFVNQTTGFASGRKNWDGLICKTTNAGANWTEYITNRTTPLYSIFFTNVNTGYTVGNNSLILKTTNCGSTWDTLTKSTSGNYLSIFFVNENTGFIGSNGFMLKSTNAGANWFTVNINLNSHDIKSIFFINQNTGFTNYSWSSLNHIGTYVFKTTNCGITWNSQNIYDVMSGGLIRFLNLNTGYICGNSYFLKTTNCGVNWFPTTPIYRDNVNSLDFVENNIIFAVGHYGNLFIGNIMSDSLYNISSIFQDYNRSIAFTNQYTGFIAAQNGIFKTTDSGNDWVKQIGPPSGLLEVTVVDSTYVYASGYSGKFIKSTNLGQNWIILQSPTQGTSLFAVSKDTVYLTRLGGSIFKTMDSGQNWISINTGISSNLYEISFRNSLNGFIGGLFYGLLKTTNAGTNWDLISVGENLICSRIEFVNESFGIAAGRVGESPVVFITINGGENWSRRSIPTSDYFGDADFTDENTGYFMSSGNYNSMSSTVWKTTNCGVNWYQQYLPFQQNDRLESIRMVNSVTGFIIGYNTVLKTTNGGMLIGISLNSNIIPSSPFLFQNYPNPFNPVTKIKYDIPPEPAPISSGKGARGMIVRLIIYDVLGREIETLVNQTQKPGSYEVTWDGSRYASGVYFYRMITDDFMETKKMVLIK